MTSENKVLTKAKKAAPNAMRHKNGKLTVKKTKPGQAKAERYKSTLDVICKAYPRPTTADSDDYPDSYAAWCELYECEGKKDSVNNLVARIISNLEKRKHSGDWVEYIESNKTQYIPYLSKYLRKSLWKNTPPEADSAVGADGLTKAEREYLYTQGF